MNGLSAISTAGMIPPGGLADSGALPELRWIDIAALYVDLGYQREIGKHSKKNIAQIAANFDWAFFTPVIVARAAGDDFFRIVDGQHRTTAAKLIGKTSVPCSIVAADRTKQARAFGAINANVTRVHTLQLHRSAVAAGDPEALAVESAAAEGLTRILSSPKSDKRIKPGETVAVSSLRSLMARFGREPLVRALLAINAGPRTYRALINRDMLEGILMSLDGRWARDAMLARFHPINLGAVEDEARKLLAERKGRLSGHIHQVLAARLAGKSAPPQAPVVGKSPTLTPDKAEGPVSFGPLPGAGRKVAEPRR